MFNIHIVNRFLEGVMARSTNSSKKNITTTTEAVKTAPVTKESVTEKDKNVTKANEVKKETEKVTSKETEKTAPKKVTKKSVEKKTAVKEPEAAKTEEVKAEAKAAVETKNEEAKSAPKKRGRKPGSKNKQKEQLTPEVYVQYHGEEAEQSAIIEKIKEQYVSEGHRAGNIKSLKLYLKPEDRAAYFVINDRYAGKVDLFNF